MSEESIKKDAPKDKKSVNDGGVVTQEVKTDEGYNVQIMKDYYGNVDPFYLSKKHPDYVYRFLRADHKNLSMKTNNMLFDKGGWQVCNRDHLRKIGISDRFISESDGKVKTEGEPSADGLYRVGDTVLAFMPKSLYEEKEKHKNMKANEKIDRIKKVSKDGDRDAGGREIHDSMKGIQTQEQLRGNWR